MMMILWEQLNMAVSLLVIFGFILTTDASIPNSLYGKGRDHHHQEDSRNHLEKGDIIDLDDSNYDITDVKDYKLRKHKTHVTIDQDSDDTDTGPYGDIFDDVELVKIDEEPIFKSDASENKAGNNLTVSANGDDEDLTAGSGSGDITVEIEEDPKIINTTDDVSLSGNVSEVQQIDKRIHLTHKQLPDDSFITRTDSTKDVTSQSDEPEELNKNIPLSDNLPPFCEEFSNITWAPWSPWIRAGDVDIRFRRCPTDKGYSSNANHCRGDHFETRNCDQHDVKMCRTSTGYLTEMHQVSCTGIDFDDIHSTDELRDVKENKDSCEYTLYDLKYDMPVGSPLTTDGLMSSDPAMWCGAGDTYVPFYTPTERCLTNLKVFCKSSENCKYEKKQRKELKNKGDLKKGCWRNFVLGGVLPQGIPFDGRSKLICQRFSKDSVLGKTLGYKDDLYATLYDTARRMPVISVATVQALSDEKWPQVPYMVEQGLVRESSNVISWFYKDRKRGICKLDDIADPCEVDKCRIGERQATPADFELSGYRIAPLVSPDIIGGTLSKRLSTFTLTNAAPMEPTVFSSWKKVLKTVRKFELEECRIPVLHYNDNKEIHTSRYGHELPEVYIVSGTYASENHVDVIGNDVTVPELFWMSVCCAHGADVASFGIYVYNRYEAHPKIVSVKTLQTILRIYDDFNQTDINLYPAFDSVCSAGENDVSFKIYL